MPVFLEHLHQPTEADWADIDKIHQDTAEKGLTLDRSSIENWLENNGWIMAGRFNDRLLGAVLAKEIEGQISLSNFGVRKLTQGRGVMHQLLHFVCEWSKEHNKPLAIQCDNKRLQQSLQKRGFILEDGNCYYRS